MVMASACVGLTLPGMIEEPGSFSGRRDLAEAGARPRAHQPDVVCDLEEAGRKADQRAVREDERVVRRQGLELVRRRREGQGGELEHLGGEPLGEFRMGVEPGADRRAALRERVEARQGRLDPGDAELDLRRVAGEFLPERDRGRVLQVRAADLDDVGEGLAFASRARQEVAQGRQEPRLRSRAPPRHASRSGSESFEDWPRLTWSFGWTGDFPPRAPPRRSLARFARTSFMFMLDWVPEPVCQTDERELVVELALHHVGCRRRDGVGEGAARGARDPCSRGRRPA